MDVNFVADVPVDILAHSGVESSVETDYDNVTRVTFKTYY